MKWKKLVWREMHFLRPFELESFRQMLSHLAALSPRGFIVYEVRGSGGRTRYLLGAEERHMGRMEEVLASHGIVEFAEAPKREPVARACHLKIRRNVLSLNVDEGNAEAAIASALSALSPPISGKDAAVQIILGAAHSPAAVPHELPDPNATLLQIVTGSTPKLSTEGRKSAREKASQFTFEAAVRMGGPAEAVSRLHAAFRTLESAGAGIDREEEAAGKMNAVQIPWRLPLRLSVAELSALMLPPVGEGDLPGVEGVHPRRFRLPDWYRLSRSPSQNRVFGTSVTFNPAGEKELGIPPEDSRYHLHVLGGTGVGKSTLLLNLIVADLHANRSLVVIDPKADLVNDVLERIPDDRLGDVVVVDPTSSRPAGFNPFAVGDGRSRELVAESILAVLRDLFHDTWGVYTGDLLTAAVLTLAKVDGATLLHIVPLLTDDAFRNGVVGKIRDAQLLAFWNRYDALKEGERRIQVAPVLNKLRSFTMRTGLRHVLGQGRPKFPFMDLFYQRKVVLVPLNEGITGGESARLLGSLWIGTMWAAVMGRAAIPQGKRHVISLFVDEFQKYLSLANDFTDALAQARSLGLGLTMANQYRGQLSASIRSGIDSNARSKICFTLDAADAKEMAAQAPELTAEDFMALPQHHIYTRMMHGGRSTGWVMGKTLPPPKPLRSAGEVRRISEERYGIPAVEVEREIDRLFAGGSQTTDVEHQAVRIGRRRRK